MVTPVSVWTHKLTSDTASDIYDMVRGDGVWCSLGFDGQEEGKVTLTIDEDEATNGDLIVRWEKGDYEIVKG